MNVLAVLQIVLFIFGFGIRFYSRYISRQIGSDDKNPIPAISLNDGVDHVPAKTHVLFAHHFATIAGVGPIVGPVLVWLPVGAAFIGAVHDYTSIFASVREKGRSMAEIAGKTLGKPGFMKKYWFNLGLAVALMFMMGYSNAFSALWKIFGSANQLLASVIYLLFKTHIPKGNWILVVTDVILLLLPLAVTTLVLKTAFRLRSQKRLGSQPRISPAKTQSLSRSLHNNKKEGMQGFCFFVKPKFSVLDTYLVCLFRPILGSI